MGPHIQKRDRTARMLRIQVLLGQNAGGLTIEEIAQKCSINKRTVYRDLKALESELNVPIWAEGSKRGIVEGYTLPPIPFTLPEAMHILMAARMILRSAHWYDPNLASTFVKLSSIVPTEIRKQIQNTLKQMENLPQKPEHLNIAIKVSDAWVSNHRVTIWYQDSTEKKPQEYLIEPYFVEPRAGRSSYVIAYCHLKKAICTFKLNYIKGIRVERDTYVIPSDFNVTDYLSSASALQTREKPLKQA